jgi:hypothetical protein
MRPDSRLEGLVPVHHGKTVPVSFDLTKGYYQAPVDPKSREVLAFLTHTGLFEQTRLPFALRMPYILPESSSDMAVRHEVIEVILRRHCTRMRHMGAIHHRLRRFFENAARTT